MLSCQGGTYTAVSSSSGSIEVNRLCVVMWTDNNCKYIWYVGDLTKDETWRLIVDHTEREIHSSKKIWRYPSKPDIHSIDKSQILNVAVKGEWEYKWQFNKLTLTNEKEIGYAFKNSVLR